MRPEVTDKLTGQPMDQKAVGGAYEGASRLDREVALWSPPARSADQDLNPEKGLLDSRTRDMARNEGYIQGAVHQHQDAIVGGQFLLNAKPQHRILSRYDSRFDEVWAEEYQEAAEAHFSLYAESPDNWPDAARVNTLTGLVRLAIGIFAGSSGEVLATAEWLRDVGRPYHTALQMIDLDRLSNPNGQMDSRRMRAGIERNRYGAPIAYHIRSGHPAEWYDGRNWQWRRVPVRKPWGRQQVIHIYEQNRPDQSRGSSDLVAALKEMKMTKKYRDVVLQNAVANATFAATIESELPPEAAYTALGEGGTQDWVKDYLESVAEYTGQSKNLHIDGAKIPHLYPGSKLNLQNAGTPGGVGSDFEQSLLRHIASAMGLSYEEFAHDWTQTNYSSARAGMVQTWKRMQARKRMVADKFAGSFYALWTEEALNRGELPLPTGVGPEFFYQGQNKDALTNCTWVGASRGQIDELKETQAAVLRIKSGLSTYEEESSKLGRDFREVFSQRAREERMMGEMGLTFSQDEKAPALVEGAGNASTDDDDDDLGLGDNNEDRRNADTQ